MKKPLKRPRKGYVYFDRRGAAVFFAKPYDPLVRWDFQIDLSKVPDSAFVVKEKKR